MGRVRRKKGRRRDKGEVGGTEEHAAHSACADTAPQTLRSHVGCDAHTFACTHSETAVLLSWGCHVCRQWGWGDRWPSYEPHPTHYHLILPHLQETGCFSLPLPLSSPRCTSAPGLELEAAQGTREGTSLTLTCITDLHTPSRHKHPLISSDLTFFPKVLHRGLAGPAPP